METKPLCPLLLDKLGLQQDGGSGTSGPPLGKRPEPEPGVADSVMEHHVAHMDRCRWRT